MSVARYERLGVLGGLVGAVLMSMVEMTTELLMGHGFFLPPHMIAAPIMGKAPMEHAMMNGPLYLEAGPFIIGLVGHMLWSAGWGAVFGLIAAAARMAGRGAVWWSIAYGIVVGFAMSYIVLPILGLDPLPKTSGWTAFFLMHIAYGIGPGLVICYLSRQRRVQLREARRAA